MGAVAWISSCGPPPPLCSSNRNGKAIENKRGKDLKALKALRQIGFGKKALEWQVQFSFLPGQGCVATQSHSTIIFLAIPPVISQY